MLSSPYCSTGAAVYLQEESKQLLVVNKCNHSGTCSTISHVVSLSSLTRALTSHGKDSALTFASVKFVWSLSVTMWKRQCCCRSQEATFLNNKVQFTAGLTTIKLKCQKLSSALHLLAFAFPSGIVQYLIPGPTFGAMWPKMWGEEQSYPEIRRGIRVQQSIQAALG